jgi:hypothetical protein
LHSVPFPEEDLVVKKLILSLVAALAVAAIFAAPLAIADEAAGPAWSMNATIIEACSCPMFCQCYFTSKPAGHAAHVDKDAKGGMAGMDMGDGEHYCRANNVFQVNKGSYGSTKLDGAKFWLAMDLGDDFSDGTMKWLVVTWDPSVTKPQREGIMAILGHVYPVKWEQTPVVADDLPIEWSHDGDHAMAKLDGGKAGEVELNGASVNRDSKSPVVINNLHYWGVPRNSGFVLMPNEIETYKLGPNAFEFKGTNGFMITVDINSKDVAAHKG